MRYAARRDVNEPELVALFKAQGCKVQRLSQTGVPDLLIEWNGRFALVETKSPKGTLTAAQRCFSMPFWIVRDELDAARIVRWLKTL